MAEKVILELTREQADAVMRATELLARLHLGQFKEITWQFMGRFVDNDGEFDAERRALADELLEQACRSIFGVNQYNQPDIGDKTIEHKRCWAVYATIRHALAWHDHPEGGITVNFDKPMGYGEQMPKCRVRDIKVLDVGKEE